MPCMCKSPDFKAPPRKVRTRVVPALPDGCGGGACYLPGKDEVNVSAEFWNTLSRPQRAAVLAHETAHSELAPDRCEACADARGGAIMRHWGYTRPAVKQAFDSLQLSRLGASIDALKGFDNAE